MNLYSIGLPRPSGDWMECQACDAKPGSPVLCDECLRRREQCGRLQRQLAAVQARFMAREQDPDRDERRFETPVPARFDVEICECAQGVHTVATKSADGAWVKFELYESLAKELRRAKADAYIWESCTKYDSKSPCGHSDQYTYTPDGNGIKIRCYICDLAHMNWLASQLCRTLEWASILINTLIGDNPIYPQRTPEDMSTQLKLFHDDARKFIEALDKIRYAAKIPIRSEHEKTEVEEAN